jgi:peptidoglycan lytic transglycosylase
MDAKPHGVTGVRARIVLVGSALVMALTMSACAARTTPPAPTPEKPAPEKPALEKPAPERPAPEKPAPEKPRAVLEVRQGLASYYGPGFHGKRTASGIVFDQGAMVAAHPTYPFGTVVRVTNLANRRQVDVRVVDRGPAKGPRAQGVVIDLSSGAAGNLGFLRRGRTRVLLEVLRWGK